MRDTKAWANQKSAAFKVQLVVFSKIVGEQAKGHKNSAELNGGSIGGDFHESAILRETVKNRTVVELR